MAGGTSNGGGEPEPSEALKGFGAVLKALRERARSDTGGVRAPGPNSPHYVASIEQGRRFPPKGLIDRAEEVLDADRILRAAARHLTRRAGLASWFRQWAGIEEEAISL